MEITHEGFRWMTLYDLKKGFIRQKCFVSLHETFGKKALSKKTINNWFAEIRR